MDIYKKLTEWIIPVFLGAAIHYLQSISSEMKIISKSLAVAVERVDEHERRLANLEFKVYHEKGPRRR